MRQTTRSKKAVLFTISAALMLLSLLLMTATFAGRTQQLDEDLTSLTEGEQIAYAESDVLSDIYAELLTTRLHSISRGSVNTLAFNSTQLSTYIDHHDNFQRYMNYIHANYSASPNINAQLSNFTNTFTIEPYSATFTVNGTTMTVISTPGDMAEVRLSVAVSADHSIKNQSVLPPNDPNEVPITVMYYDAEGDLIYERSIELSETLNNDNAQGRQFYQSFFNGSTNFHGYVETKFGQVEGADSTIFVTAVNMSANVTSLEIDYAAEPQRIFLRSGNISISSVLGKFSKNTMIVLTEE